MMRVCCLSLSFKPEFASQEKHWTETEVQTIWKRIKRKARRQ
jgi:hypothetical protein